MKNRTFLLTTVIIFCLCFSMNVFASDQEVITNLEPVEPPSEENMKRANIAVYDEYDLYNGLRAQSTDALRAKGYTQEDIQSIKSTPYETLLRQRGELSVDELKNYGYNDEQIAILKNPGSTDAELLRASSKITMKTVIEKLDYHTNHYTYSTVYLEWKWDPVPNSLYTDDAAIAWTGGMTFMSYSENNKSRYTLWKRNSSTGVEKMKTTPLTQNNYVQLGRAVQIPEFYLSERASGATSPVGPSGSQNYTVKGAARVALKYYGRLSALEAQGAYAHYSVRVSGISISVPWSVSISFSKSPYDVYRRNDYRTVKDL